jgi:hypothetical protein
MSLVDILKRANGAAWVDSIIWLVINVFLGIFPIICTYIIILSNTGTIIFQEPISHGELPLFSISLLGAGVYVILTGMKISGVDKIEFSSLRIALSNVNFPGTKFWYPAILFEALIATTLFVTSFTLNAELNNYQQILDIRIKITGIILILCFMTSFIITLIDASIKNNTPNAEEMFTESDKKAQDELNKADWSS